MRIRLLMGITPLHTDTTADTRTEDCLYTGLAFWVARRPRWLTTGNCLRLSRVDPNCFRHKVRARLPLERHVKLVTEFAYPRIGESADVDRHSKLVR
jgi:hypothetical protein